MVYNYFCCFSSIFQSESMSHKALKLKSGINKNKLSPDFKVRKQKTTGTRVSCSSLSKQECVACLSVYEISINNVCRITATYKNNVHVQVPCNVHTIMLVQFLVLLSCVKYYFRKLPILHRGSIVISCGIRKLENYLLLLLCFKNNFLSS